jgi:hypothetical protein
MLWAFSLANKFIQDSLHSFQFQNLFLFPPSPLLLLFLWFLFSSPLKKSLGAMLTLA